MPEGKNKAEIEATEAQIAQLQSKLQQLQKDQADPQVIENMLRNL